MKVAVTIAIEVLFVIVGSFYLLGIVAFEALHKHVPGLKLLQH